MRKSPAAESPDAYVAALAGWQRGTVEMLRAAIGGVSGLDEVIKWGNIVYIGNGPALLIRADMERVLLGFWRGQRMLSAEPRLKPSGKYEMAAVALRPGESITPATVRRLAKEAVALNLKFGNPQDAAVRPTRA